MWDALSLLDFDAASIGDLKQLLLHEILQRQHESASGPLMIDVFGSVYREAGGCEALLHHAGCPDLAGLRRCLDWGPEASAAASHLQPRLPESR